MPCFEIKRFARNYGKRNVRHSRVLKRSYMIASNAAKCGHNDIREYFMMQKTKQQDV